MPGVTNYLNKDIYIISPKSYDPDAILFGSLEITSYVVEVVDRLMDHTLVDAAEHIVINGVLCSPEALPTTIIAGVTPYILVMDEQQVLGGILELPAYIPPEGIAKSITELVNGDDAHLGIPIEQLYIIYGYELEMKLTIDEDDADDEVLDRCREVADKTYELLKGAKELAWENS